ncbi:MAG: hypothetical protein FRX49_05356 [Trebouxia sp. A1-2]|nr:MAG: hypothetical protein FRX49_05356 [Trebouxia sp. A1-2]
MVPEYSWTETCILVRIVAAPIAARDTRLIQASIVLDWVRYAIADGHVMPGVRQQIKERREGGKTGRVLTNDHDTGLAAAAAIAAACRHILMRG